MPCLQLNELGTNIYFLKLYFINMFYSPETRQQCFDLCIEFTRSLPTDGPVQLSQTQQLDFYALFKQATIGPCNTAKPGCVDLYFRYNHTLALFLLSIITFSGIFLLVDSF